MDIFYHLRGVVQMAALEVLNPATGVVVERIEETGIDEIPKIYEESRNAFKKWSMLSIEERSVYLKKLQQIMVEDMEEMVETIVKDNGKVPTDALMADVMPTLDAIGHIAKHAKKALSPQKVKTPLLLIGKKSYVEYVPRGVSLVISPWNYPLQLSVIPVVSALAGGNTVILKPSEVTPLVGKMIEKFFEKAGFPKGVVTVVHGGKEVGAALTNGKPDYIFFTGSVRTGRIIQKVAAEHLIPTTLELGGKDPFIVFEDANLKRAAKGAVWAAFTNTGQVCMSAERIFVQKSIFEDFLQLVKKEAESLVLGTDEESDVGSMTYPTQVEIVKNHVKAAIASGAKLQSGNHPDEWDETMFIKPMILTDVDANMDIVCKETFGPVMPIIPFDTEQEVIDMANKTEYGLNASVWSQDLVKARRVATRLVSGAVTINEALVTAANHHLPFGGAKQSGIGNYHGIQGMRIFCYEKAIVVDRGVLNREIQWYPYKGSYPLFLKLFKSYFAKRKNWGAFLSNYIKLLKK